MQKAIDDLSASYKNSLSAQQNVVTSMTNATAVSLIGKEVRVQQKDLTYSGLADENDQIQVNLGSNDSADVQILDDKGNVVKTLIPATRTAKFGPGGLGRQHRCGRLCHGGYIQDKRRGFRYRFQPVCLCRQRRTRGQLSSTGASLQVGGKEMSVTDVMNVSTTEDAASSMATISPSTAIGLIGKNVRVRDDSITYGPKTGKTTR